MEIGRASAIFKNICNSEAEECEKLEAIKTVCGMETKNSFTKQEIINTLNYLLERLDESIKRGVDNCYMTLRYEHPGFEDGGCAGLGGLHGEDEPCDTCKECRLYYGFGADD